MRIILYTGYQKNHWNPTCIEKIGLGGTEQCVLNLAKELANTNEVYVVGDVIEGFFDNVNYVTISNALSLLRDKVIDFVIGVSYINYLHELSELNFSRSVLWLHNTDFILGIVVVYCLQWATVTPPTIEWNRMSHRMA